MEPAEVSSPSPAEESREFIIYRLKSLHHQPPEPLKRGLRGVKGLT